MICPHDQHSSAPGMLFCEICGRKLSTLVDGSGLPYPSWEIVEHLTSAETPLSVSALARDRRNGRSYLLREYFPKAGADLAGRRRDFLQAAKSLRQAPLDGMRILYAYTALGRCYTVAEPIRGTPIRDCVAPRSPESEVRKWFRALLAALHSLHATATERGALYHGNLTLTNINVADAIPGDAAGGYRLHLPNSLYLEEILNHDHLPPEHFIALDLRVAGLIALAFFDGHSDVGDPFARLRAIKDAGLRDTLAFLFSPVVGKPRSAQQLLEFLDRPTAAPPAAGSQARSHTGLQPGTQQGAQPQPTAPTAAAAQKASVPAATSALPPLSPPWAPVGAQGNRSQSAAAGVRTPLSPGTLPARGQPLWATLRNFVLAGAIVVIFAIGVAGWMAVSAALNWLHKAPDPPTIALSPPHIQSGQSSFLQWSAKNFSRIELNGRSVAETGTMRVSPAVTTRYRLVASASSGSAQTAEATLTVAPVHRNLRKPQPGSPAAFQSSPDHEEARPTPAIQAPSRAQQSSQSPPPSGPRGTPLTRPLTASPTTPPTTPLTAPSIVNFSALRPEITFGDSTRLTWNVREGRGLRIYPLPLTAPHPLPEQGTVEVSPAATTTYVLSASAMPAGPGASAPSATGVPLSRTVTVRVYPHILAFDVRSTGDDGCSWQLLPSVQGTSRISIAPAQSLTSNQGRYIARPLQTTTYTLSAQGIETIATMQQTITISPQLSAACASRTHSTAPVATLP